MLSLAYFSPLPPTRSGIADYSRDLLPHLAQQANISLFVPNPAEVSQTDLGGLPVFAIDDYAAKAHEFDLPIYHLGNSHVHNEIYAQFCRRPGVVVLHDVVLHQFMAVNQYARELAYERTRSGHVAESAALHQRIVDLALGMIVHSQYAATQIQQTHTNLAIQSIPQLMPVLDNNLPSHKAEGVTFGSIGQITANKQLDVALAAFSRFYLERSVGRYVIVGEAVDVDVEALIAAQPEVVRPNIQYHPYITQFTQFQQMIASIDVVVTLRQPTLGETSASVLRALAQGKPAIVYDHGWYAELPDAVAIKVDPADGTALVRAFEQMADGFEVFSAETIPYIQRQHNPTIIASQYIAFIEKTLVSIGRKFAT